MKFFILFLLLMISNQGFASDYRTNEDGTVTYIGKCLLHEDYENVKFKVTEVVPYTEYPTNEFFKKLTPLQRKLAIFVYNQELNFDEEQSIDLEGFDDISFDIIHLQNIKGLLYRVSFGVGGGNGGYMTFLVSADGVITLAAHTFDGELISCDDEFRQLF